MSVKVDKLRDYLKNNPLEVDKLEQWLLDTITAAGVTKLTLEESQELFFWLANSSYGPPLDLSNFTQV